MASESKLLQTKLIEYRSALRPLYLDPDADNDVIEKLNGQIQAGETRLASALLLESADLEKAREAGDLDVQQRELDGIGSNLQFRHYVGAAVEHRAANGAEAEWNAAHGMGAGQFPLAMLAPARVQMRTNTDTDGQVNLRPLA